METLALFCLALGYFPEELAYVHLKNRSFFNVQNYADDLRFMIGDLIGSKSNDFWKQFTADDFDRMF